MADHGHKAINLVFNDKYMAAPEDLAANDGTTIDVSATMKSIEDERRVKTLSKFLPRR